MGLIAGALMWAGFDPERDAIARRWPAQVNDLKRLAWFGGMPDRSRAGVWPTARAAWHAVLAHGAPAGATHGIVFQEDYTPCLDLIATLERLAGLRPETIICVHLRRTANRREVEEAEARQVHWISGCVGCGGGYLMPLPVVREFLRWSVYFDRFVAPGRTWGDDGRVDMFALCTRRRIYLTHPSLIAHGNGASRSLAGTPGKLHTRVEHAFLGQHISGLTVDWSRGLTAPVAEGRNLVPPTYRALLNRVTPAGQALLGYAA